nr:hypothetical protein [Pseudomonas sp.]
MNRTLAIYLLSAATLFGLVAYKAVYIDRDPEKLAAEALESATKVAELTAIMVNREAPQIIDEQVRLEKAEAGPGALVTYYYTFINYDGEALPEDALAEMRADMLKQTCNDKALRKPFSDGLKYEFQYANNVGATVASVSVSAEGCRSSGLTDATAGR